MKSSKKITKGQIEDYISNATIAEIQRLENMLLLNTFVFSQPSPALVWDITHDLNKFMPVVVIDTAGTSVIGEIKYVTSNRILITFNSPTSGKCYL